MWGSLTAAYVVLGGIAVKRLAADGLLKDRLRARWGDLTLGAGTALLMLVASWSVRSSLLPVGSDQLGWLGQVYRVLGDPANLDRSLLLTALVLFVPALEELVWRGWVQQQLAQRTGARWAWALTALLYALAAAPTAFTLADPVAGPNPLPVFAALGCGLVWGFTTKLVGRLPPVMISHAAFTYFSVAQFRWPGM